jgi:hypothetical protein
LYRFATTYLTALLLPLVVAFALRSLLYDQHLSWYSWGIGAATSCVYTFGFALMCPQLYINHQLKSVSHLPWNVSCACICAHTSISSWTLCTYIVVTLTDFPFSTHQFLVYKFLNTFIDGKRANLFC